MLAGVVLASGAVTSLSNDKDAERAAAAYERSRSIEAYHNCRKLAGIEKLYCEDQAAQHARQQQREEYELDQPNAANDRVTVDRKAL